jgi:hypothetical protein
MLDNQFKLIVDTLCEVYELLKPWADGEFWDLEHHDIVPGAFYMIGRMQFHQNIDFIRRTAESGLAHIVLSNPAEGSDTIRWQCKNLGIEDLVRAGKIIILAGGDADSEYHLVRYDSFMVKILDYITNRESMKRMPEIYSKTDKPYKFLFLNGRARPHRKFLLEKFKQSGLLDQTLWTNLDSGPAGSRTLSLHDENNENLLVRSLPVQYLPSEYEVKEYQHRVNTAPNDEYRFLKNHLFNNTWGEIYLKPEPYIDTYFSLVTETEFHHPYSFRTEKIWKPIMAGHPWICASNCGFYRDLKNLGFRTFDHLIDETFDQIDNGQQRIERVAQIVEDLCQQDLSKFLDEAKQTCKYNQQQFLELYSKVLNNLPNQFVQFINQSFQLNE